MDEKGLSTHPETTSTGQSVNNVFKKIRSILSLKRYFSILMLSDLFPDASPWLLKISYCLKKTVHFQINALILHA